ncbi:MAG: dephospho-CoA kinase [Magnetococcales bacterium]|nr:dephospho-CoA kinase [Magnetococcales bacterium]
MVGVTGVMGSGKSSVAQLLADCGGHWLDADQMARQAIEPGTVGWQAVVAQFGSELLLPDGHINRAALGACLGGDEQQWQRLEQIVHPQVRLLQAIALRYLDENDASAVAVLDVPLLFETGADQLCDTTVVVVCGAVQQQRLQQRGGMSVSVRQAASMRQWSEQQKRQHAGWLIDNSGTLQHTREQVIGLWQRLLSQDAAAASRVWPTAWQPFLPC